MEYQSYEDVEGEGKELELHEEKKSPHRIGCGGGEGEER